MKHQTPKEMREVALKLQNVDSQGAALRRGMDRQWVRRLITNAISAFPSRKKPRRPNREEPDI